MRHLAQLRSICETLGGKPAYCCCGDKVDDPIHFRTVEYNELSKAGKLTEWRGMTVNREELS